MRALDHGGSTTKLEADYLVIGAGAVGMAFVDVMLDETDAHFAIVDRHHAPGGHWNDACPFVRLHQPSKYYGVSSAALGSDRIDESGSNKGSFELASGAEVLAYFERVMRERFLPSGRVRYFPMSDVIDYGGGAARFRSLISGDGHEARVRKKIVDGAFFKTSVPSMHERQYDVADGLACIAPNELPRRAADHRRFVIIGGGKTAMDAAVWLLDNGVDPDAVSWVRPRESWLINRVVTQPGMQFFEEAVGGFASQIEACAAATDADDLFDRLEACGAMLRIDQDVRPTMFHYATISVGEIDQMRRIKNVLRNGRVARIDADKIVFANGETATANPDALYIDCSASAAGNMPAPRPVFEGDLITIQSVRTPLVTLSSALIAYIEARYDTDEERNRPAQPVVFADAPAGWMQSTVGNLMNQFAWSQEPALNAWVVANRLDPFGKLIDDADKNEPAVAAILTRIRDTIPPAVMNVQKLIAEAA